MKNKKERIYLPTLAELVDRLSIITLKSIKLDHKDNYEEESKEIMHDINILIYNNIDKVKDWGKLIRAIQILMLANELIWVNETKAREGGSEQDHLLPLTHSINSLRMQAGNAIIEQTEGRKDLNLDRLVDKICLKHGLNFNKLFD